jgi:hypothetical protein
MLMSPWTRLTADEAHSFYRVPWEQAAAAGHDFYGVGRDPRDADGPWPLLALLRRSDLPAVVTVQIYTIEAEERSAAAFDPLARPCGYLSLDREALAGLVSILEACAVQLNTSSRAARQMFRRIADSELQDFGLRPEWTPEAGDQHYSQVRDPLAGPGERVSDTILILSAGRPGPRSRLYFKIARFPRHALGRPGFDVLDHSLARIHLDCDGALELARLLEAQLEGMAG